MGCADREGNGMNPTRDVLPTPSSVTNTESRDRGLSLAFGCLNMYSVMVDRSSIKLGIHFPT